jgi:hypothetical protein
MLKTDLVPYRDSWNAQKGLTKTEAKRRYITTLVDTMHRYASTTPEARELVSELEFVWDQIRSNVPSSSSENNSSPPRAGTHSTSGTAIRAPAPTKISQYSRGSFGIGGIGGLSSSTTALGADASNEDLVNSNIQPLRVLSPMSQPTHGIEESVSSDDDDRPHDFDPTSKKAFNTVSARNSRAIIPLSSSGQHLPGDQSGGGNNGSGAPNNANTVKWRRRVELAISRMGAEVAALRESLQGAPPLPSGTTGAGYNYAGSVSSSAFPPYYRRPRRRGVVGLIIRIWGWLGYLLVLLWHHLLVDIALLGIALVYFKRKGDMRLEMGLRMGWMIGKMQVQRRFGRYVPGLPRWLKRGR